MKILSEKLKKEICSCSQDPDRLMTTSSTVLVTSALTVLAMFALVTGYTQYVLNNRAATAAAMTIMNLMMWAIVAAYLALFFTALWCLCRNRFFADSSARWYGRYAVFTGLLFAAMTATTFYFMYAGVRIISRGEMTVQLENVLNLIKNTGGNHYV